MYIYIYISVCASLLAYAISAYLCERTYVRMCVYACARDCVCIRAQSVGSWREFNHCTCANKRAFKVVYAYVCCICICM